MEEEGGRDVLSCDSACVGLTTARHFGLHATRTEHQLVPAGQLDEVVPLLQAELTATNKDDLLAQEVFTLASRLGVNPEVLLQYDVALAKPTLVMDEGGQGRGHREECGGQGTD